MVLGEKLWEGKAKTTGMTIKNVNGEGMTFEHTWMAPVKGLGKAAGLDGSIMFTENVLVSPVGIANSTGNGIFNTASGDTAVMKSAGSGKGEGNKGMGLSIWNFMTMSPKLTWLNQTLAVVVQEGDPQEFDVMVWEWK